MKKFTLVLMAGLFTYVGSTQAQDTKKCLTAGDVFFGDATTADLIVNMDYETEYTPCSWGFSLYLPDGISITGEFEGDTFYPEDCSYSTETNSRGITRKPVEITKKADGGWLVVAYASGNPDMVSTHGQLVTLNLTGSSAIIANGEIKDISVSSVKVDDKGSSVSLDQGKLAVVSFGINQTSVPGGINDINATESTSPAYNLQGIRVNANAKGIVIRDGKKMVVK